jgi:hypothetical protein
MGKNLTFLAANSDIKDVTEWFAPYAPSVFNGGLEELPYLERRTLILHFRSIGPLNYWPDNISLKDYPENSSEWRQAVLLLAGRREGNTRRDIHANTSACVGYDPPYKTLEGLWVSGTIWFPQENLKARFPELAKMNGRLERFLAKQELVFDNTKRERFEAFPQLFCEAGIVQRIYAFPEALALLRNGSPMVDRMVSPKCYKEFLRRLELQGIMVNHQSEDLGS